MKRTNNEWTLAIALTTDFGNVLTVIEQLQSSDLSTEPKREKSERIYAPPLSFWPRSRVALATIQLSTETQHSKLIQFEGFIPQIPRFVSFAIVLPLKRVSSLQGTLKSLM
jgi:hypothetical protein